MSACRIVRGPESGGIWEVIQLTPQERISERIVEKSSLLEFLRFKNKLWKS